MKSIFQHVLILLILFFSLESCSEKKVADPFSNSSLTPFDPDGYHLKNEPGKQIRGQILYLPVYSSFPDFMDSSKFDMSAFLAFHNTDFRRSVTITRVQYFNSKGQLVHDFLKDGHIEINPLETVDYYIPYRDQSGTGANFLIEWMSDSLVNEPLVESITYSLKNQQTVAVLSHGKILNERK